jgi:L-alanine-DL-glutamate epimerase-like enolase superfamily enzyme
MAAVIEDVFQRYFLDQSPENIELIFRRTFSSGFTQRPDLSVMGAFSGLEIACWDILGKDRDRPVWALLGGKMNERIRAYSYLYPLKNHDLNSFWTSPQNAAESAYNLVSRGYTAVKFDPAGPYTMRGGHQPSLNDIELCVSFMKEIRNAIGNKADLLLGTHGQFTTAGAIRLGRAVEAFKPLWYEEPIPPDNLLEFQNLVRSVKIPIAAGERLTTKYEFATLLRSGGIAILQPALGRAGGIWEMKKTSAIAEVFNAQMAPHLYAGPIEWAANIQLAVSIPNILVLETIETNFHYELIKGTINVEKGYVKAPEAPGLGIDVDEDLARQNPFNGDGLHLMMQDEPCDYKNGNFFLGGAPPIKN